MKPEEYEQEKLYRVDLEEYDEQEEFYTEITITNKQWWTASTYAYICGMDGEMDNVEEISAQLNVLNEKLYPSYTKLNAYYMDETFLFRGEDIINAVIGEDELSSDGIEVFSDMVAYSDYREAVAVDDLSEELKAEYEFYMLLAANDYIGAMEYVVEHELFTGIAYDNYKEYLEQFYALSEEQQQMIREELASYPPAECFISYTDESRSDIIAYMIRAEVEEYSSNPESHEKWLSGSMLYDYQGDDATPVDPYIEVYYAYGNS